MELTLVKLDNVSDTLDNDLQKYYEMYPLDVNKSVNTVAVILTSESDNVDTAESIIELLANNKTAAIVILYKTVAQIWKYHQLLEEHNYTFIDKHDGGELFGMLHPGLVYS